MSFLNQIKSKTLLNKQTKKKGHSKSLEKKYRSIPLLEKC